MTTFKIETIRKVESHDRVTVSAVHPVPTSTPLKNRYSHPIPSFCYVVEKKRRHILPICHFLCFFFISINLNNSMHFRQSSNNKYLYLLLFQSHCRWDSLFQTCLSFPVFQSRYRMRLSILEGDTTQIRVILEGDTTQIRVPVPMWWQLDWVPTP